MDKKRTESKVVELLRVTGEVLLLMKAVLGYCKEAPRNISAITHEMVKVGINALFISSLMAFFGGLVLALQTGYQLSLYGLENSLGSLVGLSMIKELGPILLALLFAGRNGSSMAAEIGTMQVAEEIDALRSMGIDPVRMLAMPRFLASLAMLPMLVIYGDLVGIFGGAVMSRFYVNVPFPVFFRTLFSSLSFPDILEGLIKSIVFGITVALISCHQGFRTHGGAEEVGKSTIRAVVFSSVSILIFDYFVTKILMIIF